MRIAILALQGAFAEHQQMLTRLGADTFLVRNLDDWQQHKDGLVIPGGESTAMLRIMNDEHLMKPIRNAISNGLPVLGTCAGMILLAQSVENDTRERLATMDITVRRNAYGRQLGSFFTIGRIKGVGDDIPMTFIRAPYITAVGADAESLAEVDGHIVAASQHNQIVCSFHPELNSDTHFHEHFLAKVEASIISSNIKEIV